ncbi:MAG: DNA replication complex GINS family protein [Thermoplasmatales archaeon]|nr:DNA replication complex GINS family protein [Thermoplasmatales archaeon]
MKFDDTAYMTFRKIQLEEEKSPLLTKIEWNFYSKLSEFKKNPNNMTEKEIQNIEKIFVGICEIREKKIAQAALSKARGGKPDLKNMLDEEKKIFDSIVDIILQSRKRFFSEDQNVNSRKPYSTA